ncbi:MAG: hypothetical protein GKS01_14270 [Alphaproteobacteria bacterium]|nr:hypothetical protein [Alphaproteobacteria bacterium]
MTVSAQNIGIIAVASIFVVGCSSENFKSDHTVAHERTQSYLAANPSLSPPIARAIGRMELHKGMTKEQIIAAWGKPAYIQRYSAQSEQWFFGCGWPHSCDTPDEDTNFPLLEEIFNSRAIFNDGKLSEWTS